MKFVDIKGKTEVELKKDNRKFCEELFELKMKNSLGQLNSPIEIRKKRRDIARVKTAITQKQEEQS